MRALRVRPERRNARPIAARSLSLSRPPRRRVRNNLKMGVVGLPNVGKSSLFNLLCEQACAAVRKPRARAGHRRRNAFCMRAHAPCISRHTLACAAQENCASLPRRFAATFGRARTRCRQRASLAPRACALRGR